MVLATFLTHSITSSTRGHFFYPPPPAQARSERFLGPKLLWGVARSMSVHPLLLLSFFSSLPPLTLWRRFPPPKAAKGSRKVFRGEGDSGKERRAGFLVKERQLDGFVHTFRLGNICWHPLEAYKDAEKTQKLNVQNNCRVTFCSFNAPVCSWRVRQQELSNLGEVYFRKNASISLPPGHSDPLFL